jgi:N-acetylglucosamine-6-phosphate deacetylase
LKNVVGQKLVSLCEGLAMSSTNAAACLGLANSKGRVLPQFDADLVLLNKNSLNIEKIFYGGNLL